MEDIKNDIATAFKNLAYRWCSDKVTDWSSLAGDIWAEIELYLDKALPAEAILAELSPTDLLVFHAQMETELSKDKDQGGVPKFLRDIVSISLNLTKIDNIRDNVFDIKRHFADYYKQIRIEHAQYDYRIQIDELYVNRDLVDWQSRSHVGSSETFSNSYRPRIVVTGDPGVGKSTFTEHLIWTLAHKDIVSDLAPLVINCREYAAARDASIFSVIRDKLASTLHLRYTDQDIEDILTLGRAFLIIDGVDEILDLSRRRDLIRTVEVLGNRFPLCPIVATTRNIGYSQAKFDSAHFRRYELRPFTENQIEEYVRRWFKLTERPEADVDRFLLELESIPDLRSNPLMLSLLCILYRARGYIPRNRRQIYSQCADLLFNRWDRMRHIEQPYDHQHYGDELMQEIASWFYNSQSAQAGLEEQQIHKVIAMFLIDTAAVPRTEAEKRASTFLDFCADRAWLLGSIGSNNRGQRVFVFTHRTFMEFFAAESLVRSSDMDKVVSEVAKNYDRDASSVLPDLIVQSAEVHRKGGARDIISGLFGLDRTLGNKNTGKYLPLCLRIINLSPVNPRLMEEIFERVFRLWASKEPSETGASIQAVLGMYRDPRHKFMECLNANSECIRGLECTEHSAHPMIQFLIRWAHQYQSNAISAYGDEWDAFVAENIEATLTHLAKVQDTALRHMLIEEGYLHPKKVNFNDLVTAAFNDAVPGFALRGLYRIVTGRPRLDDIATVHQLANYASKGNKAVIELADRLAEAVGNDPYPNSYAWTRAAVDSSYIADVETLILWIACVTYEAKGLHTSFNDLSRSFLNIDYQSIFNTRDYYLDKRSVLRVGLLSDERDERAAQTPLKQDIIEAMATSWPNWFIKWCLGRYSLVRESRAD